MSCYVCKIWMRTQGSVLELEWKYKVALSYVGMDCAISSIICHAAPPPVDLGQRGVVLRCFEALTGDGQLLVSAAAAVY